MTVSTQSQQEWLKILDKGMLTIPKEWRDELGFTKGKIVKAKRKGRAVIIEPVEEEAPYRIYTDKEITAFLKEDKL